MNEHPLSRLWWMRLASAAGRIGLVVAFALMSAPEGSAQDSHSGHHPAPSETAPPTHGSPTHPGGSQRQSPPAGPMGEAGMMGAPPRKEFYPSLMDLPTLSAEQRQAIEARARAYVTAGFDEVAHAENALRQAFAAGDAAAMEQAARRLREGLHQVSSGTAALRALAEGKAPPQIAQDWFKGQMNLGGAVTHASTASPGPLGLSWLHILTMAVLTAFAVAMVAIYVARMRRANALIDRLAGAAPVAAPASPPTTSAANPGAPVAPAIASSAAPTSPSEKSRPDAALQAPVSVSPRAGVWTGKLRVAAIFAETPNVKTFRLRDPQGGPIGFSFVPGQFLTYSAEIEGKLVRRSYTIASSAAQTSYVEATIKREDSGIFSEFMHGTVKEGDLVDVMGPSGAFTFRGEEADSVVLIGGGVGITPLMAAIRYLTDIAWPGEIFLVYGARTTQDFIFRDELEYLQRRHTNLHVAATMARAAGTSWMGTEGPITKELLAQAVPEIAKRRIHLCGPPGMMAAIKGILADLGAPGDQIKTEAFGPARGAVPPPGVTVVSDVQSPAGSAARVATSPPAAVSAAIGPATASIRFARSDKTAPLPPDKTVLEVAESIGVPIDYACRAGTCGTCKTRLLEGKVTMEVEDALTPEDKTHNIILACQARSIGNLVVEA